MVWFYGKRLFRTDLLWLSDISFRAQPNCPHAYTYTVMAALSLVMILGASFSPNLSSSLRFSISSMSCSNSWSALGSSTLDRRLDNAWQQMVNRQAAFTSASAQKQMRMLLEQCGWWLMIAMEAIQLIANHDMSPIICQRKQRHFCIHYVISCVDSSFLQRSWTGWYNWRTKNVANLASLLSPILHENES